jgi:hypothetical protein
VIEESSMEWFLFESLIALLVLIGIVWWTMRSPRPARGESHDAGDGAPGRVADERNDDPHPPA